jgi:Ca2+/Na+ antiporter
MVLVTIIIPVLMLITNIEFSISFVPIFVLLFLLFYYINSNVHKLYLQKQDKEIYSEIEQEKKLVKGKISLITKYSIYLLFTTVALYLIGDRLSVVLENLAEVFNISEAIIGVALGFITSIPELMTFFESQKHHKKHEEQEGVVEATNNLLTSNVLNLFVIQSIGIIILNLV